MSKGTGAVAVFALLIAAGATGFIVYDKMQPPSLGIGETLYLLEKFIPPPGVKNTWYSEYLYSIYTDPFGTTIPIDEITIVFKVNPGESVYLSFTSYVYFPMGGSYNAIVRFIVDGAEKYSPQVEFGMDPVTANGYQSCALQASITLSSGTHTVTIGIRGSDNSIRFDDFTLLVQTYVP